MGSLPQFSILKGPTRKFNPEFINDIIESRVGDSNTADKIALIFEDGDGNTSKHTYAELNIITNKLARVIKNTIVQEKLQRNLDGDYLVAVNLLPTDRLVLVLLAIWKAGAAYLPLDHAFPGARIEHIMREAKPALVIFDEDSDFYVDAFKLSIDELWSKSSKESEMGIKKNERLKHQSGDLAIALYTSGSTGVPKGVKLPHKVILNRLNWQFKAFPFSETEKVCVFKTALTFVDSISEIWGPLMRGLSLLVIPKEVTKDPERLIEALEKYKVERLVLVPSLLRSILMFVEIKKQDGILSNLKTWVCSGETLVKGAALDFYKYFPENEHRLCNFYGSTEIMGDVTYYVIKGLDQMKSFEKVPIGNPVDNTIVYLLDSEFRPVKAGEIGELYVSGLNLASGYINGRDPDKFIENPLAIDPTYGKLYRTGDFARLEKGTLMYEGRTDSQVKIRGHRVDLTEVEKAVSSIEEVDKAVVLCYKPGEMSQALLAFVTTKQLVSESWIEAYLRKKLTAYMIPQVILVETIPLLVNGKIDRQGLLKMYENTNNNDDYQYQVDIDYTGVPSNQLEAAKVLFETVASVLNRAARAVIKSDANFYNLGGNSLNSIYTITKLNEQGYRIGISDFIAALDLGEILERMTAGTVVDIRPPQFTAQACRLADKEIVTSMITESFYRKADLEQWILSEISENDYRVYLDDMWDPLVEKGLSFIVKNEYQKVVGACINFDLVDEPEVDISSGLLKIFEFLDFVEGPFRQSKLPKEKNKTLHCHMMGTHSSLTSRENILVIQFMEEEVYKLAKNKGFEGILTVNTSPLTQQLGRDVFKYEVLQDYQVNQYVAPDNTKPFGLAPDSQRALIQWKAVV
uniref:Ebony n=1 Tax=Harmonia axyridis TaxID=115357 RepID=A0A7G7YAI5_HARAX|nr:ebony [Harmonia axyridis]